MRGMMRNLPKLEHMMVPVPVLVANATAPSP